MDNIVIRRVNGDDMYSWGVFVNGKLYSDGLTRAQAANMKRTLQNKKLVAEKAATSA